jgi:hypothetical protein
MYALAAVVVALVTHETTDIDAEGVTRTSRWQERVIRDADQSWIERVLPHEAAPARDAHAVNLRTAARWYVKRPDGGVTTALVSVADHLIVDIDPGSRAGLGLEDRWRTAAQLVDLDGLAPTQAVAGGSVWYARASAAGYVRVLWNERLALPLAIDAGTWDGRSSSHTRIEIDTHGSAIAPWSRLDGFHHADLSDLED